MSAGLMLLADIVDVEALGKTVLFSFGAGVGIALAYAVGILGAAKFLDLRRDGRYVAAASAAALTAVSFALSAAAIAFGLILMIFE